MSFASGTRAPMVGVLIFAIVLLAGAAISGIARRSILSTAVLFLVAGLIVGRVGLGLIDVHPTSSNVAPASSSVQRMVSLARSTWAAQSPDARSSPASSSAVQPLIQIQSFTCTARA